MKTTATLIIAILCLLISCARDTNDDEPRPKDSDVGCITGIPKDGSSDTPVFIRCSTRKQFGAGSNTNIGGTSNWMDFTYHQWTKTKSCEECQN